MILPLAPGTRLRVTLAEAGTSLGLGALRQDSPADISWQWSADALLRPEDGGANLAVRQLPLTEGVHRAGKPELDGLPGFLADSLPDGWGRLMLDRSLARHGVPAARMRGVDRLALVGRGGPGALVYAPELELPGDDGVDLDALAAAAATVLAGRSTDLLDTLLRAGGSAGGSRPKAWLAVDAAGHLRTGASLLEPGETGYLVKFRSPQFDPPDIGPLELAYALMAMAAGLDPADPWLIETPGGRYFASKRFDRVGPERVHVLSAAAFLDVPSGRSVGADYGDLLRLTRRVTRSEEEVVAAFRHAAFNVLAHNRDDHLKQFAFLRRPRTGWVRAPAFDLTFSSGPGGEHTLLVAGEGREPGEAHLRRLGLEAGLSERVVRTVLQQVRDAVSHWSVFARDVGVTAATRQRVASALRQP